MPTGFTSRHNSIFRSQRKRNWLPIMCDGNALRRALKDADSFVARDAARALGALGIKAGPSVSALIKALSHGEPHVRLYAAEALSAIGPKAAKASMDLARTVGDPIPGVRWAACEALANIGPAAQTAVPQLIKALKDDFLFVRICSAGALGSIGPKAQTAMEALRVACKRPGTALRSGVGFESNRWRRIGRAGRFTPSGDASCWPAIESSLATLRASLTPCHCPLIGGMILAIRRLRKSEFLCLRGIKSSRLSKDDQSERHYEDRSNGCSSDANPAFRVAQRLHSY